ncbi:MAG: amidohydrolase [Rhodothermales bacterium]
MRGLNRFVSCILASMLFLSTAYAQNETERVIQGIDKQSAVYAETAQKIWSLAEVGYQEHESAALLISLLEAEGFSIEKGVAGIPTAFVASYGSGSPVVGIMGEYDALPGISQTAMPTRQKDDAMLAGHACGHHLFGTGSVAAAIGVKEWLAEGNTGTIRLYGTPAEEGGAGKVYLVREGLFDDVDVALHWHPGDKNDASSFTTLANRSAKFRFYGVSAHAAAAPERGRSALDGVEAMNLMINMMREHVPQETRIHYVITSGGSAPNVIPDFAEVYYYVRNPDAAVLEGIWDRVVAAAEGAAMGTGTRLEFEVIHGIHSLLPNEVLADVMHESLNVVGGVHYNETEQSFAEKLQQSFEKPRRPLGSESQIQPNSPTASSGSTDVGDVSWVVPTAGLSTATWVPGTAAHSWQAVAAGGTSIGAKGMMVAAKTLALTAINLFKNKTLISKARAEFDSRRGPAFEYHALLGDRAPPLDYRK